MAGQPEVIPFPARPVRFRQVVARCGRPDVHLALVAPARDRILQDLQRRNRVLTIRPHHRGTGADYGVVGLFPARGAQFLVFDRSLQAFAGRRVVGIDYSLLENAGGAAGKARAAGRGTKAPQASRPRVRPRRQVAPAPGEAPSPPGPTEVRRELRRILRLLEGREVAPARIRLDRLMRRMAGG